MIHFFEELPEYEEDIYSHKKMKTNSETSLEVLKDLLPIFEAQSDYSNDALYETVKKYVEEKGYKNGYVLWPLRIAVTGKAMTPCGATEAMEILGHDETVARIKKGIELLEK
jgi:glutamyl-tRNA synthetase